MSCSTKGGLVTAVDGVAKEANLRPGDRVLAVDGHPLRDIIDFRFYADGPEAEFLIARGDSERLLWMRRPVGTAWGIEFAEPLFDGIRRCNNHCLFCFLDQLPKGWRRSLYLRDDDYRLSFLYGNFVTLTRLQSTDWARLKEQRLSPLYVSVHATDRHLRQKLLGNQGIPDIRRQLVRLGRLGIIVHAQVVLCPGLNDGAHLRQTISDLVQLTATVRSVSLVPVGLTRYRACPPTGLEGALAQLRPYTVAEGRQLLRWAEPRQRLFRDQMRQTWLYLADEFYLMAGRTVPVARFYDGFPQLENGVGLVRQLRDDWFRTRRRLDLRLPDPLCATLVCGTMIAPSLQEMAADLESRVGNLTVRVLPVHNHTFGPTVTVSGLLTGETLLKTVSKETLGDIVFLPRVAFDLQGVHTLDDVTISQLEESWSRPIVLVQRMSDVIEVIAQRYG
jgi:putative radical SAM enzyme (TIGR03279 family)